MPSQHVAYLFSRYPVVSQTFCDSEMLAMEALGHRVTIASLNIPPDSFRHERLRNLRAEALYPPPKQQLKELERRVWTSDLSAMVREHESRFGSASAPLTRARNALAFAPRLRKRGINHVHVHFANRATHTALFLKKLGFSFSFTAHAQDFLVDIEKELLAELVQEAEFVAAVSDYSANVLRKMCPHGAGKIHRVYNGLDLAEFPVRNHQESHGRLRITSIGRLIEFKGFQHLLTALAQIKHRGTDFSCEIIGEGPLRDRLLSQVRELQLTEDVSLPGTLSQDQIRQRLAQSDLFCLPSIVDSQGASDILPTVILEAMAAGLPVVSTNLVGIPEMVEHGKTGLLVAPGDEVALANALQTLAGDREMRVEFGKNGRQKVGETFRRESSASFLASQFSPAKESLTHDFADRGQTLCYTEAGPDDAVHLAEELPLWLSEPEVSVVLAPEAAVVAEADELEFLPDGLVLESYWNGFPALHRIADQLRAGLGATVDGELFLRSVRRALWLCQIMRARSITHLHALRSSDVLVAWLAARFLPVFLQKLDLGLRMTAAIEEEPATSRPLLAKLLPDFTKVGSGDAKLREKLASLTYLDLFRNVPAKVQRLGNLRWYFEPAGESHELMRFRRAAPVWVDSLLSGSEDDG